MAHDEISLDDPWAADVHALLTTHLDFNTSVTPPEEVHALAVDGLVSPDIAFFSLRRDGRLLAVGALLHLDDQHVELKSIHTAAAARRQGVGRAMIDHLVREARSRGYQRVSLETGTMPAFEPARALYASAGFVACEPFGEYYPSPHSACMTMWLNSEPGGPG